MSTVLTSVHQYIELLLLALHGTHHGQVAHTRIPDILSTSFI